MNSKFYILIILVLVISCSETKQEETPDANISEQEQTTEELEITKEEIIVENTNTKSYLESPLTYLIDGELYFYNHADNKKTKFIEETDPIFNYIFDTEGKIMYYNVERDNSLWLKSVDISKSEITPEWLINWKVKKNKCITETYLEISPLMYHKGKVLMKHNFSWQEYDFERVAIYSIANKKITRYPAINFDMQPYTKEVSYEEKEKSFDPDDQQLYYILNNKKICLTNKLDFKSLVEEDEDDDEPFSPYYMDLIFSPDKTKILIGTAVAFGDLSHGPYSIVNSNGSNQMMLDETDIARLARPVWLKNNSVAFTDKEEKLYVANNDTKSIKVIAENVSYYAER